MISTMPFRSPQDAWETALGQLQVQVTRSVYDTWFKGTRGLSLDGEVFTVGVPSPFVAESLETRFHSLVKKALVSVVGRDVGLEFRVVGSQGAPAPVAPRQNGEHVPPPSLVWLNNRYTFDAFVVGSSNRLAYAAAQAVADKPGNSYNPLFIYGGAGLGKTHLLHAVGHAALQKGLKVLCVSAEQFTNEFINAIRERSTETFCQKYRGVNVLLIDDIQFIAGKEQTEEGFFHTFNDLHNANRQIVLTSDRPPKSLTLLEDRLRSRFEWGLIADIQPPELETRMAILQAKARSLSVSVPQDVLQLVARRYQRNIRELEGALNRVLAFSRLTQTPITADLAARALEDVASAARPGDPVTLQKVVDAVSGYFEIPVEALTSKKRDAKTALARQVAMYLVRDELHLPLAEIGSGMGGRDHSTVLHACEKIEEEININPQLRRRVLDVRALLHPDQKL